MAYYCIYGVLIFTFSYLWVAMMFRPVQVADELKKSGGYIPGVRPGQATAQYLDFIMTRLTFAGSIFLTAIAVFPDFLYFSLHIPYGVALFFGGTGTLITVGVLLEMMRQVETYLVQRNYDSFFKRGRRGHFRGNLHLAGREDMRTLRMLWTVLLSLLSIGLAAWLVRS
jgi:preprotein translocase subunit SecY